MYAVFQISGFQYSAQEGEVLQIPLQDAKQGDKIDISEVLLVKNNDDAIVGTPFVENAKVEAEVLGHGKNDKVLIYKYKRRTKYRRRQGHRQDYSEIKINKIVTA
ncbi:MAG TPA: 50S ribosomal protein L21 [candidate division Zixibacteria bacterium]|nr:50S ribosomal protein L21 [candidate division Zixibacteria bacterium]